MADDNNENVTLVSDEPTVELIIRAQRRRSIRRRSDPPALPSIAEALGAWRLPAAARGHLDTADLVQDAAMHAIAKLDTFEPRHVGAMQAVLAPIGHQQNP